MLATAPSCNTLVAILLMSLSLERSSEIAGGNAGSPTFWEATASFLRVAIVVTWVGVPVYGMVHYLQSPDPWTRIVMSSLLMVIGAVSWICLAHHKIKAAILIFGIGIWMGLIALAIMFGGVTSTPMVLFPLMVMLAGWWCSAKAAWLAAVITIIATIVLVVSGNAGLLPDHATITAPERAVTQCFAAIFAAALITYLVRSYKDRLLEVERLSGDLTKRTVALQEIERDLNRAQAVARVGSWVYDLQSDRMTLSDETCRIFGFPLGARGDYASYVSRVIQADRESVQQAWRDAIAGRTSFDHEHRIMIERGERWVRQLAEFQLNSSGEPVRAVGTTQDITERKLAEDARAQLEAQLRDSQKMEALGTLAGGIAHDFNNVLAAIMGNVELARQDVGRDHAACESLDEIARAAERAGSLVQKILAFSRRQVLETRAIDLTPVVKDTVRLLRATQPQGLLVDMQCRADTPVVMADAARISQALVNLCTNAWHAVEGIERAGEVIVRLAPWGHSEENMTGMAGAFMVGRPGPGRYACLTVSDNGVGMDAQVQRRIFEPFFTTKANDKGIGLGLAVVHGIMQGHEACIAVQSRPGEGTTISLLFPEAGQTVVATPPEAAPEWVAPVAQPLAQSVSHGRSKHVLYIDDDEALVILISRLLQRRGYRVSAYAEAGEAMAALRAAPDDFDLVVTDYNMPGTSGLTVARTVREIRADLPVAMASGYLTSDLRTQALAAGVRELIQKPDTVDGLCDTVARLAGVPGNVH